MALKPWLLPVSAGLALAAANLGPDLLLAAKKGQTAEVRKLLDRKAPVNARDRDGRTPLMLAAEHARADTVTLLLSRRADAAARHKQGWTAWGLALFSSGPGRKQVLEALPAPRHWKLALRVETSPENLYSSCSMPPRQLAQFIAAMHLEQAVAEAIHQASTTPAEAPVTLVAADATDADAVAAVTVRPQVSCVQQEASDNLSLAIDLKLTASGSSEPLLEKTFGGGLKGLHARRAAGPSQYQPVLLEWAKGHTSPIWQAMVSALIRANS